MSAYRNQGIGKVCLQTVIDFAFQSLKLNKLELEVYEFNPRAVHVYEALGFVKEGTRRQVFFRDGKYYDSIVMGLLRQEWAR